MNLRTDGSTRPPIGMLGDGLGALVTTERGGELVETCVDGWRDRIRVANVIPPKPLTCLIRPDGYVIWTPDSTVPLQLALKRWFGNEISTKKAGEVHV